MWRSNSVHPVGEFYLDVVDNLRCDLIEEFVAEWVCLGSHD